MYTLGQSIKDQRQRCFFFLFFFKKKRVGNQFSKQKRVSKPINAMYTSPAKSNAVSPSEVDNPSLPTSQSIDDG